MREASCLPQLLNLKYKNEMLRRITFFVIVLSLTCSIKVSADEGMWLVSLIKKHNASALKELGLEIPPEQLTGENLSSPSLSVVRFGSGCTGSFISKDGLLLTNYHCSYSAIHQLSNSGRDIYEKGFWALERKDELPVKGISVTVNIAIFDVSGEVLPSGSATLSAAGIREGIGIVESGYKKRYPKYKTTIKSYNNNKIFIVYIQQIFKDVRLVGVAPKNIAKFGGETDNWMWPRHSADFALFRIYADTKGNPSDYSPSNVPLKPVNNLNITTDGYKEGDMAFSLGYPATTRRSSLSFDVWATRFMDNPPMIAVRTLRQSIIDEGINRDNVLKLKYQEKFSSSANYNKNAVGMNFWIDKTDLISLKENDEKVWIDKAIYLNIKRLYNDIYSSRIALNYLNESFGNSCEVINFVFAFGNWLKTYKLNKAVMPSKIDFMRNMSIYYKNIDIDLDKEVTMSMLALLRDSVDKMHLPDFFRELTTPEAIDTFTDSIYSNSIFSDTLRIKRWIANPNSDYDKDPIVRFENSIEKKRKEIYNYLNVRTDSINRYMRELYKIKELRGGSNLYPDADNTLRLSYGKITSLNTGDKIIPFATIFAEILDKGRSENPDYKINPLLLKISDSPDFDKSHPVCFITNGDVTGGNSGSPMLNSKGEIIGLVFDCNWESMTRDYRYDINLNRVICLDIRYMLLIIEKLSNSSKITDEILN